jgi:hypothetical protein
MKKPYFDNRKNTRRPNHNHQPKFSIEKLQNQSSEIIEMFKLIQAVRRDRVSLQEEYNASRLKFSDERMSLDLTLVKIKKEYNARITALQEEYNSVKYTNASELNKIRKN